MVLSILPLALVKVLQSTWLGGHQIHFHESKLIEFVGFLGISYVTFKSVQLWKFVMVLSKKLKYGN